MPWYLRKSIRTGPVRWNLSKSGIGMSVGVRGLRVGTGPRGSYIAGGRNGIYFRQSLSGSSRGKSAAQPPHVSTVPQAIPAAPALAGAPVQYLPETYVDASTPASADTLARYISSQRAHHQFFWWVVATLVVVNLFIFAIIWQVAIVTTLASIGLAYYVWQWDRKRTQVVLHYALDPTESASYQQLCNGLQALASTVRLLRVDARQVHGDWKRNAGATTALHMSPAVVTPPGSLSWLETEHTRVESAVASGSSGPHLSSRSTPN